MGEKICLDTNVIINSLKDDFYYKELRQKLVDKELYITTITLFELYQRKTNIEEINIFISNLKILDFNTTSAILASNLFKLLKSKGITIEYRDLFIASITLVNDCELLTNNTKDFKNIPKLRIINA